MTRVTARRRAQAAVGSPLDRRTIDSGCLAALAIERGIDKASEAPVIARHTAVTAAERYMVQTYRVRLHASPLVRGRLVRSPLVPGPLLRGPGVRGLLIRA
jgi:hypothetical protein